MLRSRLASAAFFAGTFVVVFQIGCSGLAAAAPRAVLELFTSQGCSSCPPADKLLGQLAKDPSLVALSLPIDIWDYLGWKDTLALPGHALLQRAYAKMRGDRQVYTPQVIVNGATHALGSDRAAVEQAIAKTTRNAAVMALPVLLATEQGGLTVTVRAVPGVHAHAEVWLCPIAAAVPVTIGRGENDGLRITYHNVVRGWRKLGDYSGADETFRVPLSAFEHGRVDGAAVMVQEGTRASPGIMLGAAYTPLATQATVDRR